MTTKNEQLAKKYTGMTTIPFVSEGIAAEISGFVVTEDALTAMVEACANNEAAQEELTGLQAQLDTANAAKKTAEDALVVANASVTEKDAKIKSLEARVAELEEEAGITTTSREKDTTETNTKLQKYRTSYDDHADAYTRK